MHRSKSRNSTAFRSERFKQDFRFHYTRLATCCLQDNFFNFFRMASTTLRLVDYDFQRFQDRFDYSSDYWLVDHDLKKFPRCARPVPLKKGFITAFPFIKGIRFFSRAARGHFIKKFSKRIFNFETLIVLVKLDGFLKIHLKLRSKDLALVSACHRKRSKDFARAPAATKKDRKMSPVSQLVTKKDRKTSPVSQIVTKNMKPFFLHI